MINNNKSYHNMGNSGNSGHDVCRANQNIDRVNCFSGNDFGTMPFNHCMSQAEKIILIVSKEQILTMILINNLKSNQPRRLTIYGIKIIGTGVNNLKCHVIY